MNRLAARVDLEREEWGWDTVWCFFSGDYEESADDGKDGFYDIRDIWRIAPVVVPLLSLTHGTSMEQNEAGEWAEIVDEDDDEIESHKRP